MKHISKQYNRAFFSLLTLSKAKFLWLIAKSGRIIWIISVFKIPIVMN